jgi:acyl-coenzyme A thioesterase PaaI-like protein
MTSSTHIVAELGLEMANDPDSVAGSATVIPEVCVPGAAALRTSVLATWTDVLAGAVAARSIEPRIPLTLDLEVQLYRPTPVGSRLLGEASLVRAGRTIVVTQTRFRDAATGELHADALASFVTAPGPGEVTGSSPMTHLVAPLAVPLAERCGSRIVEPGTAEVPHRPDGLNPGGAIQGGLVALAAEKAAASLHPEPVLLASLNIRFLRPFMVGPAHAVATGVGGLSVVHVSDAGTGKLGAIATGARPQPSGLARERRRLRTRR